MFTDDRCRRALDAHAALGLRRCTECSAPEGMRVVRVLTRPVLWSLDLELHLKHPNVYRHPSKVVIEKAAEGVCRFCASPKGRDHVLHNRAVKRAQEALRAQD